MGNKVEYSNLLARILLDHPFDRQFVIPEPPRRLFRAFLRWYEAHVMKVDVSEIKIDRPIVMLALPRAGASILQNIICTHPEVSYLTNTMHKCRDCFCAAEHVRRKLNLNAKGERYLGDSVIVDVNSPADGIAFWGDLLKSDPFLLDYVEHSAEDFASEEIEEVKEKIRKIIFCFGSQARRFFCKNPFLLPQIRFLKDLFPDAKFVHVVRDPRMACNSLLKLYRLDNQQLAKIRSAGRNPIPGNKPLVPYPRLPGLAENVAKYGAEDVRTTAHLWNDAVSFVNQRKAELPAFHEVRYEDILADPQKEVFRIFDFCELEIPGKDKTAFWDKIGEFGAIRHKNAYGDFEVIESICRDNMRQYGYL